MSTRTIIVTDRDFWPLSSLVRAGTAHFARDREHIARLEEGLARSVPVALDEVPSNIVTMHSRVRVCDLGSGVEQTYSLVYPHEADLRSGRLSILAPLGTALLGYREGDEIEWEMPGGMRRLRIESVRQAAVTLKYPDHRWQAGRKALPRLRSEHEPHPACNTRLAGGSASVHRGGTGTPGTGPAGAHRDIE